MNYKQTAYVLLAIALFCGAQQGQAELTKTDWRSVGDELLVTDSETGLSWVYLPATYGYSYNDVLSLTGSGQYFEGCRLGTTVEVNELLTNGGIPTVPNFLPFEGPGDSVNAAAIDLFQDIMGLGINAWGDPDSNVGITADRPFGTGTNDPVAIVAFTGSGGDSNRIGRVDSNQNSFVSPGDFSTDLGAWVVAQPIPEPATAIMLFLGSGIGLFIHRLRRWANR